MGLRLVIIICSLFFFNLSFAQNNFYKTLGVKEGASLKEIKQAYKRLVKKYHPDLNQNHNDDNQEKIKSINIAYEALTQNIPPSINNKQDDSYASNTNEPDDNRDEEKYTNLDDNYDVQLFTYEQLAEKREKEEEGFYYDEDLGYLGITPRIEEGLDTLNFYKYVSNSLIEAIQEYKPQNLKTKPNEIINNSQFISHEDLKEFEYLYKIYQLFNKDSKKFFKNENKHFQTLNISKEMASWYRMLEKEGKKQDHLGRRNDPADDILNINIYRHFILKFAHLSSKLSLKKTHQIMTAFDRLIDNFEYNQVYEDAKYRVNEVHLEYENTFHLRFKIFPNILFYYDDRNSTWMMYEIHNSNFITAHGDIFNYFLAANMFKIINDSNPLLNTYIDLNLGAFHNPKFSLGWHRYSSYKKTSPFMFDATTTSLPPPYYLYTVDLLRNNDTYEIDPKNGFHLPNEYNPSTHSSYSNLFDDILNPVIFLKNSQNGIRDSLLIQFEKIKWTQAIEDDFAERIKSHIQILSNEKLKYASSEYYNAFIKTVLQPFIILKHPKILTEFLTSFPENRCDECNFEQLMLKPEILNHPSFPSWFEIFLKHTAQFSRFIDKIISGNNLVLNFNDHSNIFFPIFFNGLNKENLNSLIKSTYEIKGSKGFSFFQKEFIYLSKTPQFVELVRYLGTRPYSQVFNPRIEPQIKNFINWLKNYEPDAANGYLKSLNIIAEGNTSLSNANVPRLAEYVALSYNEVLENLPENYIIGSYDENVFTPRKTITSNTCFDYLKN